MIRKLRVLNVEDSERDVALVVRHLTVAGYDVISERVDTAASMRNALETRVWDIILCDYSMPRFNALAALAALHETKLDIPLIIISGTVGEDIAVEAMLTGANDYLAKDNLTRLVPAIERELQEAKNRRKQFETDNERRIIFEIIQGVVSTPNLDEFLKLVHLSISAIMYAENCFVMLYDEATEMMHFEFWVDKRDSLPEPQPLAHGFASHVVRTGQPLLITEEKRKALIESGEAEQVGTYSPSWLGVPLRTPSRTIGVLVLQHYEDEHAYNERHLEFLSSVGDHIALAIERKRAEDAVRLSEERYRLLFEKNPEPMWVYDLETLKFLEVNNAAIHHYGYTREEFGSMTIKDIRPHEQVPALLRSVHDDVPGLQDGQAWQHRKKDGTLIDVEITSHSLIFAGVSARLVLATDVTESNRAKSALRESEERYRDLVENAIDIIYTHDLDGRYTSVNRAVENITGYSREEALNLNLIDTVAPEYVERAKQMIAEKLAGREITAYEIELIAKDGHRVAVEVNSRIVYENGIPVGVQGIARDITERKQLEGQFLQSQKMEAVGLLAGGIAHDFNNLLTAITGYSDLALRKLSHHDPLRVNIKEIKDAGERAAGLTSQLLAFSRKQVMKPRVHNLNTVITNIERMLRRIIKESIDFRTVLDPQLGNIKADPGQIEQVIMNLAVNARDAMPDGGTLTLETRNEYLDGTYISQHLNTSKGNFVRMTVTDTGHGMDTETMRRIFEPFFSTKEVGKGTGLGLSTVHGIIKQSGGDIMVYSELGHGTSFKVYLPCVDESVQTPRWEEGTVEDNSGTETILLVEDDDMVRNLVREILESHGYTVLEAVSGAAALPIFDSYRDGIHLLLSDMIMPGMSGVELMKKALAFRPELKTLLMSGYTDESLNIGGTMDVDTAFIEKPFTPDSLARKVREVLES